jgi:hypothetical protein
MSPKRYAFINTDSVVVNVIIGDFDEPSLQVFIDAYHPMFGAIWALEVADESVQVWMGGRYDNDAGFLPPPAPEIVEGTSEVMPEPEPLPEPLPEPETEPEV